MPDDITPNPLPDGNDVVPPDGKETVAKVEENAKIEIKDILSKHLGKDFKTDESALKAVKDTFNFVGGVGAYRETMKVLTEKLATDEAGVIKLMESIATNPQAPAASAGADISALQAEIAATSRRVEELEYFKGNPEMEQFKDTLLGLAKSTGKPIAEVAKDPTLEPLFAKAKSYDEAERSRSVVHSNPRLGQVRDKMAEAKEMAKAGDYDGASNAAVNAVVDALR
jgi:hypothetical protein